MEAYFSIDLLKLQMSFKSNISYLDSQGYTKMFSPDIPAQAGIHSKKTSKIMVSNGKIQ